MEKAHAEHELRVAELGVGVCEVVLCGVFVSQAAELGEVLAHEGFVEMSELPQCVGEDYEHEEELRAHEPVDGGFVAAGELLRAVDFHRAGAGGEAGGNGGDEASGGGRKERAEAGDEENRVAFELRDGHDAAVDGFGEWRWVGGHAGGFG